jgi:hypothetical protein
LFVEAFLSWLFANLVRRRCWCLTPVILATQESETRRIVVHSQPWQIVPETVFQNYPSQNRAGEVAQVVE